MQVALACPTCIVVGSTMKVAQTMLTAEGASHVAATSIPLPDADLLLAFGGTRAIQALDVNGLRKLCPGAVLAGCSTAGAILQSQILDDAVVLTAVRFEDITVRGARVKLTDTKGGREAGASLAAALAGPGLRHVFVLSDGLHVNGSELVCGLGGRLPPDVVVTGGLAGDGQRFEHTVALLDSAPEEEIAVAIGFYGERLRVGYGSFGGWDPFGTDRLITKSSGNVLYELDGESALDLYKRYLGDYAKDLPSSALLFPLLVRVGNDDAGVVRTILGVDEAARSMTFAGEMPVGSRARLMKANFDRLIDGASEAARVNAAALDPHSAQLALLVSCVGRRLVLKQRAEEEVEAVRDAMGQPAILAGFYSYGEISPLHPGVPCNLHNQTMSITTFTEV